jgi:hypothetical protein
VKRHRDGRFANFPVAHHLIGILLTLSLFRYRLEPSDHRSAILAINLRVNTIGSGYIRTQSPWMPANLIVTDTRRLPLPLLCLSHQIVGLHPG